MTKNLEPLKIELTDEEEKLLGQIDFDPSPDNDPYQEILQTSCLAAADLTESVLSRDAIPKIRLQYFTDPKLNIGTKKSKKQIFEEHGNSGREIFEHPDFLKFLKYFIFGPQLPEAVIEEFRQLVTGSYTELKDLSKFSRYATRNYELDPHAACEEFYKLALECGLVKYMARMIRDDVRSVR
jgi:hypothetical protein